MADPVISIVPAASKEGKMTTLTETRIDVADQHTTLYYLGATNQKPLPFGSEEAYCGLHAQLQNTAIEYAALTGSDGSMLSQLGVGYHDNNYWNWVIGHGDSSTYASYAWKRILPIEARLRIRVTFVGKDNWHFKVAPVPRALIYPFGWSTWVSLLVTGPHTVEDLADLVQFLFKERCLLPEGESSPLSLLFFFNRVAEGIRSDAFGGKQTREFSNPEVVAVSTVLAKYGGSYSLGALSSTQQGILLRLVRPQGPLPLNPFRDYVRELSPSNGLEYVLRSDRKRFIWVDHLLSPEDNNHMDLECYHNNTFHSLIRAGHLQGLLDAAATAQPPRAPSLDELAGIALGSLKVLNYRNASLRDFVENDSVKQSIAAADKLLQPSKP